MSKNNKSKFPNSIFRNQSSMQDQTGQIIIESLVGISVAIVGILGALSLLSSSIGTSQDISQKFSATYLAIEGVEVVKNIVDSNCVEGRSWNYAITEGNYEVDYNTTDMSSSRIIGVSTKRLNIGDNNLYSYAPGGSPTNFARTIIITEDPSALGSGVELGATSLVNWTSRGGDREEIRVEDHFFDWRPSFSCRGT